MIEMVRVASSWTLKDLLQTGWSSKVALYIGIGPFSQWGRLGESPCIISFVVADVLFPAWTSGHVEAAIKSYKQALVLRADFPEATCNLLHTLQVFLICLRYLLLWWFSVPSISFWDTCCCGVFWNFVHPSTIEGIYNLELWFWWCPLM
jgi:hypothetical protein